MSSDDDAIHHEDSSDDSQESKVQAYHDIITDNNYKEYFEAAKQFVQEKEYVEACVLLRALILKGSELFGSQAHIRLASAYFEMGHALLEGLEQTPEAFLAQQPPPDEPENSQESVEDIQSAWENLEVARTIVEKYLREQPNIDERERRSYQSLLANTYLRLGDLQNWKEDFSSALAEYENSLLLLKKIEDPASSRRLAELYFLMGNTHVYNFGVDNQALDSALHAYREGRFILGNLQKESNSPELEELLLSFDTKINEVNEELQNKLQIIGELEKIRDISDKRETFPQSRFEGNARQLGKFVAGKRLPDESLPSKEAKKVIRQDSESENQSQKSASSPSQE